MFELVNRSGPRNLSGLSLLEFSVVVAILSTLAATTLSALFHYEEVAEAAVVNMTVQNVRAGLRYQIADHITQGKQWELRTLLTANPFSWVSSSPEGYVGNVTNLAVSGLPKGSWFFDVDRGDIGYVPKLNAHLAVARGQPAVLRWRVEALKSDVPWEVEGISLVPVIAYTWF